MKKRLALLLALLMAATGTACGNNPAAPETEAATDTAPVVETVPEETAVSDDLPESDFGGFAYNIFNANTIANDWFISVFVTAEEDSGDALPSAIYHRNLSVEDRLNIVISETEQTVDQIKTTIAAGDDTFDMALMQGTRMMNQAQAGYLLNLKSLPYQNFDKPYWDNNAADQLSIAGKLYLTAGDFITTQYDETICTFFNKKLLTNYQLEDPYTLVKEGKWTLDKVEEMSQAVVQDANGDGQFTAVDTFGMMSWSGVYYMYLLNGCGQTLIEKDENDVPVFTFYNEGFINAYEKILTMVYDQMEGVYCDVRRVPDADNYLYMFPGDHALLWMECISWAKILREMEASFGIVPAPKYDEAQDTYYSCNNGNFFGLCVPVTVSDRERTSIILEALQSASTDTVRAAYYDVLLKSKLTRDEESAEMMDIIFDSTMYDCSTVFGLGGVKDAIYTRAHANNRDLASYWNQQQKSLETAIAKLVDTYNVLES